MILVYESVELSSFPISAREALELLIARIASRLEIQADLVSWLEEVLGWGTIASRARREGSDPDLWVDRRLRKSLGLSVRSWASRDEFLSDLVPIFPEIGEDLELLAQSLPEREPDWVRALRDQYLGIMVLAV